MTPAAQQGKSGDQQRPGFGLGDRRRDLRIPSLVQIHSFLNPSRPVAVIFLGAHHGVQP